MSVMVDVQGRDCPPVETRRRPFGVLRWAMANRGAGVVMLLCLTVYLTYSLSEYAQYLSNGYDLGIFDQSVRAYAHFRAPISPIKAPGFNLLGDHFSPVIALLAPLYWIWDNPVMLLVAQAVLMAVAVPIVHRTALRHTEPHLALLISAFYGLGWPLLSMVNFDFHEVAFAVPLLAGALDALDRRDHRRLVFWCLALLTVKEDMGFVVATMGVVVMLTGRRGAGDRSLRARLRRPAPVVPVLVVVGLGAYLLTTGVLIPQFSPSGDFVYWQYDAIGHTMPDALINILTQPWHAVRVFFVPFPKTLTTCLLLLPLAVVPLRSPYLLVALPFLFERFFNSRSQVWIPLLHYNALPWVALTFAFIDGAARLSLFERAPRRSVKRMLLVTWMVLTQVCALWSISAIEKRSDQDRALVPRLTHWDNASVLERKAAVAAVPAGVCVEADNGVIPHLTQRNFVTLPGAPGIEPDYIIYDLSHEWVGPKQTGPPGEVGLISVKANAATARSGQFRLIGSFGPMRVYRAIDSAGPSVQCGPLGSGHR